MTRSPRARKRFGSAKGTRTAPSALSPILVDCCPPFPTPTVSSHHWTRLPRIAFEFRSSPAARFLLRRFLPPTEQAQWLQNRFGGLNWISSAPGPPPVY